MVWRGAWAAARVALRYFNAAGADPEGEIGEDHDPETHLIPLVLDAALGRRAQIDVFGTDYPTPDGTRDPRLYPCAAISPTRMCWRSIISSAAARSLAFNLGTGQGHSVREVIAAAERVTGRRIPQREAARRAGDPPVLVADAALANRSCSAGRRACPISTPSSAPPGPGIAIARPQQRPATERLGRCLIPSHLALSAAE